MVSLVGNQNGAETSTSEAEKKTAIGRGVPCVVLADKRGGLLVGWMHVGTTRMPQSEAAAIRKRRRRAVVSGGWPGPRLKLSKPRREESARCGGTREAQEGYLPWTWPAALECRASQVERAGF